MRAGSAAVGLQTTCSAELLRPREVEGCDHAWRSNNWLLVPKELDIIETKFFLFFFCGSKSLLVILEKVCISPVSGCLEKELWGGAFSPLPGPTSIFQKLIKKWTPRRQHRLRLRNISVFYSLRIGLSKIQCGRAALNCNYIFIIFPQTVNPILILQYSLIPAEFPMLFSRSNDKLSPLIELNFFFPTPFVGCFILYLCSGMVCI